MTSNENKETFEYIQMIKQPKEIKVNLYLHQLASVHSMETRECKQVISHMESTKIETNIGINGDQTGYGKTLSMATLVHRNKMQWNMDKLYIQSNVSTHANGQIKIIKTTTHEKINTTLILANQSIITQWYKEVLKTPLAVSMITSRKAIDTLIIDNYDVVIVTPTMYNRLINKYSGMAWKRFIFDEPGHMKVPGMVPIISGFTWLVSATPLAIIRLHKHSRSSYIYKIIEKFRLYTDLYIFNSLVVKNSPEFIQHSFSMPQTNHVYHKCYNPLYQRIKTLVTPKINEMISAGNIQGVIKALGGGETENITELVRKKKLDEIEIHEMRLKIFIIRNKPKQIMDTKNKIQRIRDQITTLNKKYNDILAGDCNICMEKINKPVLEPSCQNIFCGQCLFTWLKNKPNCPLCREHVDTKSLVYITNSTNTTNTENKHHIPPAKTKINTIIDLIQNKPKGKFIIFSAWDQTFGPIRDNLNKNNIKHIEIKGSTQTRVSNLKNFCQGNTNVIFLNSRFNGSGINLVESTDIIVYHHMDQSTLNQIIGRANRLGRLNSLNVHHLEI
jgi:hypothetical protein